MFKLEKHLEQLVSSGTHLLLKDILHGIEKEGLRVEQSGALSQSPHPKMLGSALTNSNITTDFSESLLEFITPVFENPGAALQFLKDLHGFTYNHLGAELIWAASMPCCIPDSALIPIARFGSSNIGQMKYIYRVGLKHRYGKMMQSIAGIHYNFSLSDDFWQKYQQTLGDARFLQTFRSASYFKMIRNFRRHSWLLIYLFGASPALCESFFEKKKHKLLKLHDQTLYKPYATSLRMSDLGYSTKAQSSLNICFNHLNTYLKSLYQAVQTPYPPYEKIGVKVDGTYRQLNDTILQIENEHYSDVRPKRLARPGVRPLEALSKSGVEYIEIRNIDVNPFLPVGIDIQQALFLDTFLVSCLLMDNKDICPAECDMVNTNMQKVINRGREPGLKLKSLAGERSLKEAGTVLLNQMLMTAKLLDKVHCSRDYGLSVESQIAKIDDPDRTPSAQVMKALRETGLNYSEWVLLKSRNHKETFRHESSNLEIYKDLARRAALSIKEQHELETGDVHSFDHFLTDFLSFEINNLF